MKRKGYLQSMISGRTMLETIAVLLLMVILTYGGMVLYKTVSVSQKADSLYEDLMIRGQLKREGIPGQKKKFSTDLENKTRIMNKNITEQDLSGGYYYSYKVEGLDGNITKKLLEKDYKDAYRVAVNDKSYNVTNGRVSVPENSLSESNSIEIIWPKNLGGAYLPDLCDNENPCPGALICSDGICVHPQTCDDCAEGEVCFNGECVPGSCSRGWCCPSECKTCDLEKCKSCMSDYYLTESGVCHACPEGATTGAADATECHCPNGKTHDTINNSCICPAGSWLDESGKCHKCNAGTYCPDEDTVEPTLCPAGTYSDEDGASACSPCDEDCQYSAAGATSCSTCNPGMIANSAHTACENAVAGDTTCGCGIHGADGRGGCRVCEPGTTNGCTDGKSCSSDGSECYCPAGHWMNETQCTDCPDNATCDGGSTFTCDEGYVKNAKETACITCSDIDEHSNWNSRSQKCVCAGGVAATSTDPKTEKPGYYGAPFELSATGGKTCQYCEHGWDGSKCYQCLELADCTTDTYRHCPYSTTATICDRDTHKCLTCGAIDRSSPWRGPGDGACGSCFSCLPNATCTGVKFKCDKGYYASYSDDGSVACVHCSEGTYKSSTGNEIELCQPCPANATCDGGSTFTCDAEYEVNSEGNGCDACQNGKTSDAGGTCHCPAGTLTDGKECKDCPANATCDGGSTFTCDEGYGKNSNSDGCVQCSYGKNSNDQCYACEPNTRKGCSGNAGKKCNSTGTACNAWCAENTKCGCSGNTPCADGSGGCYDGRYCSGKWHWDEKNTCDRSKCITDGNLESDGTCPWSYCSKTSTRCYKTKDPDTYSCTEDY